MDLIGAMNQRHPSAQAVGHSRRVDEGIYPRSIHIRNPIQVDQRVPGLSLNIGLSCERTCAAVSEIECPGERNSHGLGFSRNLNRQPRIENSRHDLALFIRLDPELDSHWRCPRCRLPQEPGSPDSGCSGYALGSIAQ